MNSFRLGGTLVLSALAGVAIVATGCSGRVAFEEEEESIGTSSLSLKIDDPNFAGNSVYVCGQRKTPSDGKYPCFDGWDKWGKADPVCDCFEFAGGKNDGDYTVPSKFKDLCPSANIEPHPEVPGPSPWSFWWVVYNGPGCGKTKVKGSYATPITDPNPKDAYVENEHNFVCFDREDLAYKQHPNQTKDEILEPGKNTNHIVCITKNASKDFDFDVCVEDSYSGTLDCGCTPTYGKKYPTCECPGQPGIANASGPPPGFEFTYDCRLKKTETY